jgi:hypothetical protein
LRYTPLYFHLKRVKLTLLIRLAIQEPMIMPDSSNPREVLGSNRDSVADDIVLRLGADYNALAQSVAAILAEARTLPLEVNDESVASVFTDLITRMRDLKKRVDGIREAEKEPYLTGQRAVDQFFFSLMERLEKRKATDKAGGADVLYARLHAYNQKRLDEERRQRAEAERAARAEEDRLAALRRKAEDDRIAAEEAARRARKQSKIEEHERARAEASAREAAARAEETAASIARAEAAHAASAKPADLVRERHESGAMNTMRQVGFAEVVDPMALDRDALWPFIDEKALAKALLGWAKISQFKRQMPGASVGFRDETIVL